MFRGYTLGQEVLAQGSPGQDTLWFLRDGHGATRTLANAAGTVAARYDFDAFGNLLGGNPEAGQPSATSLLSASGRWDAGLQMDYLRARYYQPNVGRFDRMDAYEGSAAEPLSLHRYAFNHNDPVNRLDPSGNFSLLEIQVVSAIQQVMQSMSLDQGKQTMEFIQNNIGESAALTTALAAIEVFEDIQLVIGIACIGVLGVKMAGAFAKGLGQMTGWAKQVLSNRKELMGSFASKANEVWQAVKQAVLTAKPANGTGLLSSDFAKRVRTYLRTIEEQTGFRIPKCQRNRLAEALRSTTFSRLTRAENELHRKAFTQQVRNSVIAEWEANTGRTWPTYTADIVNESGTLVKRTGDRYDAHHIIENVYSGPHEWWNITPARNPDQHQGGIHVQAIMELLFP